MDIEKQGDTNPNLSAQPDTTTGSVSEKAFILFGWTDPFKLEISTLTSVIFFLLQIQCSGVQSQRIFRRTALYIYW